MMELTCTAAVLFMLSVPGIAGAADRSIPTGLPIACWGQEKDLSLKTAEPSDPVLYYLSPAMDFGRLLFPIRPATVPLRIPYSFRSLGINLGLCGHEEIHRLDGTLCYIFKQYRKLGARGAILELQQGWRDVPGACAS